MHGWLTHNFFGPANTKLLDVLFWKNDPPPYELFAYAAKNPEASIANSYQVSLSLDAHTNAVRY